MLFLIAVEIVDGLHEHRDWGIVEAQNLGEAEKMATTQIDIDNDDSDSTDEAKYWSYGDGMMKVRLYAVHPLTEDDAQVLQKLGIAYIINK